MENIDYINQLIRTNPLALLTIKSKEYLDYINKLLPFSTGFEIECGYGKEYNLNAFKAIPYILDVSNDGGEQRYRIPTGLAGLICLYLISDQLKRNSALNLESGIHYHVDCTDCFSRFNEVFLKEYKDYILSELDTWHYKGKYNSRDVGYGAKWLRLSNEHKTLEFRCGEMTFDYSELVKNILHANQIVSNLKNLLHSGTDYMKEYRSKQTFIAPSSELIRKYVSLYGGDKSEIRLNRLRDEQKSLEEELQRLHTKPIKPVVDVKAIIKNRTQKIN